MLLNSVSLGALASQLVKTEEPEPGFYYVSVNSNAPQGAWRTKAVLTAEVDGTATAWKWQSAPWNGGSPVEANFTDIADATSSSFTVTYLEQAKAVRACALVGGVWQYSSHGFCDAFYDNDPAVTTNTPYHTLPGYTVVATVAAEKAKYLLRTDGTMGPATGNTPSWWPTRAYTIADTGGTNQMVSYRFTSETNLPTPVFFLKSLDGQPATDGWEEFNISLRTNNNVATNIMKNGTAVPNSGLGPFPSNFGDYAPLTGKMVRVEVIEGRLFISIEREPYSYPDMISITAEKYPTGFPITSFSEMTRPLSTYAGVYSPGGASTGWDDLWIGNLDSVLTGAAGTTEGVEGRVSNQRAVITTQFYGGGTPDVEIQIKDEDNVVIQDWYSDPDNHMVGNTVIAYSEAGEITPRQGQTLSFTVRDKNNINIATGGTMVVPVEPTHAQARVGANMSATFFETNILRQANVRMNNAVGNRPVIQPWYTINVTNSSWLPSELNTHPSGAPQGVGPTRAFPAGTASVGLELRPEWFRTELEYFQGKTFKLTGATGVRFNLITGQTPPRVSMINVDEMAGTADLVFEEDFDSQVYLRFRGYDDGTGYVADVFPPVEVFNAMKLIRSDETPGKLVRQTVKNLAGNIAGPGGGHIRNLHWVHANRGSGPKWEGDIPDWNVPESWCSLTEDMVVVNESDTSIATLTSVEALVELSNDTGSGLHVPLSDLMTYDAKHKWVTGFYNHLSNASVASTLTHILEHSNEPWNTIFGQCQALLRRWDAQDRVLGYDEIYADEAQTLASIVEDVFGANSNVEVLYNWILGGHSAQRLEVIFERAPGIKHYACPLYCSDGPSGYNTVLYNAEDEFPKSPNAWTRAQWNLALTDEAQFMEDLHQYVMNGVQATQKRAIDMAARVAQASLAVHGDKDHVKFGSYEFAPQHWIPTGFPPDQVLLAKVCGLLAEYMRTPEYGLAFLQQFRNLSKLGGGTFSLFALNGRVTASHSSYPFPSGAMADHGFWGFPDEQTLLTQSPYAEIAAGIAAAVAID